MICQTLMERSRCHLPSGKVVWLCPDHQKADRVTVLATGDVVEGEFAEDDDFFISQIVEDTQSDRPSMLFLIIDHIRSTREGNVFTGVCLCLSTGGGVGTP